MTVAKQQKDGGTFLLVVDITDEFTVAVDYASDFAQANRGHIALLNVIDIDHFDHWGNIEGKVKKEMRTQAENLIYETAGRITSRTGMIPMVCIEEGSRSEVILETINTYPEICMLILGGDSHSSNPGPLVSYFAGKGLSRLRVPLMIVPGHLQF
ncbi:MAG: universal stress protein [Rhodospirillales bacterium]|nr:universal stress protein [Alphaproteobacteria bacterium]MCB1839709.1 universal stress protein [Alphaproteobacteria bacterium]MCB9976083.1 universal stress protein [Rhodospirillales bacterium]